MKKTHRYDESYSLNPSVKLWHLAAFAVGCRAVTGLVPRALFIGKQYSVLKAQGLYYISGILSTSLKNPAILRVCVIS